MATSRYSANRNNDTSTANNDTTFGHRVTERDGDLLSSLRLESRAHQLGIGRIPSPFLQQNETPVSESTGSQQPPSDRTNHDEMGDKVWLRWTINHMPRDVAQGIP